MTPVYERPFVFAPHAQNAPSPHTDATPDPKTPPRPLHFAVTRNYDHATNPNGGGMTPDRIAALTRTAANLWHTIHELLEHIATTTDLDTAIQ